MEFGLEVYQTNCLATNAIVLILVLMEFGLEAMNESVGIMPASICLNPCFNGIWS